MDFMRLLKSIEELIYELVTWILFYPLTLWKIVRRPMRMLAYAERELTDKVEDQFDDALSPPVMLLLTLVLLHIIEVSLLPSANLPGFLADDRNTLLLRAIAFSILPLLFAVASMRISVSRVTRNTLKPAFYSQSYAVVPFVIASTLASQVAQSSGGSAPGVVASATLFGLGLVWFVAVETTWLAQRTGSTKVRTFAISVATLLLGLLLLVLVGVATALVAVG